MTGPAFAAWLRHMQWTKDRAARELGCGVNQPRIWEREGAPHYIDLACEALASEIPPWSKRFEDREERKPGA